MSFLHQYGMFLYIVLHRQIELVTIATLKICLNFRNRSQLVLQFSPKTARMQSVDFLETLMMAELNNAISNS